jgi:hypothetical protein
MKRKKKDMLEWKPSWVVPVQTDKDGSRNRSDENKGEKAAASPT